MSETSVFKRVVSTLDWVSRFQLAQSLLAVKWPTIMIVITAGTGIIGGFSCYVDNNGLLSCIYGADCWNIFAGNYRDSRNPLNKLNYFRDYSSI